MADYSDLAFSQENLEKLARVQAKDMLDDTRNVTVIFGVHVHGRATYEAITNRNDISEQELAEIKAFLDTFSGFEEYRTNREVNTMAWIMDAIGKTKALQEKYDREYPACTKSGITTRLPRGLLGQLEAELRCATLKWEHKGNGLRFGTAQLVDLPGGEELLEKMKQQLAGPNAAGYIDEYARQKTEKLHKRIAELVKQGVFAYDENGHLIDVEREKAKTATPGAGAATPQAKDSVHSSKALEERPAPPPQPAKPAKMAPVRMADQLAQASAAQGQAKPLSRKQVADIADRMLKGEAIPDNAEQILRTAIGKLPEVLKSDKSILKNGEVDLPYVLLFNKGVTSKQKGALLGKLDIVFAR